MRFALTAAVQSRLRLKGEEQVELHPFHIRLTPDSESGFLARIEISGQAGVWKPYLTKVDPGKITRPAENPLLGDLQDLLRHIESVGALWFGIRRIFWNEAEERWIPESPEERTVFDDGYLLGFSSSSGEPDIIDFEPKRFAQVISSYDVHRDLLVPLSFAREGFIDYDDGRYLNAFINLYFVVEYLYGQGKTKNKAIQHAFKANDELLDAVDRTLLHFRRKDRETYHWLLRVLKSKQKNYVREDVLDYIVNTRGQLFHAVQGSSRPQATPDQFLYRRIAFLMLRLAIAIYYVKVLPSVDGAPDRE